VWKDRGGVWWLRISFGLRGLGFFFVLDFQIGDQQKDGALEVLQRGVIVIEVFGFFQPLQRAAEGLQEGRMTTHSPA
jgi:hypothetical protein